jgi:hypothetical protein
MNRRQKQNTLNLSLNGLRFRVWMVRRLLVQAFVGLGYLITLIYGLLAITLIFALTYAVAGARRLYAN